MMRVGDAATRYGVTTRQIDYWIRQGYLDVEAKGSGRQRLIPAEELPRLALLADLHSAGFTVAAAAQHASGAPSTGTTVIDLGPGIHLHIDNDRRATDGLRTT